jgi:hypothetical protein
MLHTVIGAVILDGIFVRPCCDCLTNQNCAPKPRGYNETFLAPEWNRPEGAPVSRDQSDKISDNLPEGELKRGDHWRICSSGLILPAGKLFPWPFYLYDGYNHSDSPQKPK